MHARRASSTAARHGNVFRLTASARRAQLPGGPKQVEEPYVISAGKAKGQTRVRKRPAVPYREVNAHGLFVRHAMEIGIETIALLHKAQLSHTMDRFTTSGSQHVSLTHDVTDAGST